MREYVRDVTTTVSGWLTGGFFVKLTLARVRNETDMAIIATVLTLVFLAISIYLIFFLKPRRQP